VARFARSDLRLPDALVSALTIYLLLAIGLKGGAKLDGVAWAQFLPVAGVAVLLCLLIPVWTFWLLRGVAGLSAVDAGALAAHYGSVSAVTFGAAVTMLDGAGVAAEPFMPALLALMEGPGILVALLLVRMTAAPTASSPGRNALGPVVVELFTSKGVILLVGGLGIGLVSGRGGFEQVAPLFDPPFKGVLMLFLLELGLVTGGRLADLRRNGLGMLAFGVVMPILHGLLGVWLGQKAGLGVGGATILGTLAASASYIAAPAAVRLALPEANPALYLTSSLAVTFPFNVTIGIPLYLQWSRYLAAA
jgi:hypothetical protein